MPQRVVCVFAHPDDDTYGVGGTLAQHEAGDLDITVVMTTSGEAGQIADPSLATRRGLGRVREAEDRGSWQALGLDPVIRFLRYPDGGVADVAREDLVDVYTEILLDSVPDVLVTFGPDGITGHEDHVAVGAAATEAFHIARLRSTRGFRRLLYTVLSHERLETLNQALRARGMDPMDPAQPYTPRGVPDRTIGVSVDCSAAYQRKLEALRCHRTQGELEGVPYDLWPSILGREDFVIAWPGSERPVGAPPLRDVLEGLGDA